MKSPNSVLIALCILCAISTIKSDYVIAPTTTIEPSSRESWEEVDTGRDFAVPDPSDPLPSSIPNKISSPASTPVMPSSSYSGVPEATLTNDGEIMEVDTIVVDKPMTPEIYSFHIESNIRYRYSRTSITSRVVNRDAKRSSEIRFRVVLPETAFISKFLMEIDGKTYEAYVKEKEEAKRVYNEAQSQGQNAGLVEVNTRNTNVFDVNVNIKASSKVNFNLTYEELLSRRLGHYEQSINISPEQVTNVKDFQILVTIEESQNITLLRVPNLRNDVDVQQDEEGNNKDAIIERSAGNKAKISWKPSEKDQSQLDKQKLTGKFIVQYDISRELDAGEVLVMNGYFVHFFAPENLKPLRKHVVFILDTSGSMWGRRLEQLKEAMNKILADLTSDDFFNIITFASDVVLWSPEDKMPISTNSHWSPPGESVSKVALDPSRRQPYAASSENIEKAQSYISSLVASGGTNIHDSIVQALNLTNIIKAARDGVLVSTTTVAPSTTTAKASSSSARADSNSGESTTNFPESTTIPTTTTTTLTPITSKPITILPQNVESMIIFLTDGEPTVGVTNPTSIQSLIKLANTNSSIPLFSLGFGDGADFPFLRKLSLQNNGFARKIYEASDAALQLKGFYNEIASPLLSKVTFNYTSPEYSIENVTISKYATVFGGTEIAVAGKIVPKEPAESDKGKQPPVQVPQEIVVENATTTTSKPTVATIIVGENPAMSSRDDYDEDNVLVPTEKRYFDVVIDGYGRDGIVHFHNPEIFSSPIPWGIPVQVPFPPRPTVPPTQEDVFLERLWAYLTIKQLIEKDLAQESENNEIVDENAPKESSSLVVPDQNGTLSKNITLPETPKQRALRLALKYGFVTPLTSLVVVKPNSTDVTDSVPTDPQSQIGTSHQSSFATPFQNIKRKTSYSTGNRISGQQPLFMPLSLHHASPPRVVGFGPGFGFISGQAGGYPGPNMNFKQPMFATTHAHPVYLPSTTATYGQFTTTIRPHTPMVTPPSASTTVYPPPHNPESVEVAEDEEKIAGGGLIPESAEADKGTHEATTSAGPDASASYEEDTTPTSTSGDNPTYSLSDLSWYFGLPILVNSTSYKIAETDSVQHFQSSNCTINSEDSVAGRCVHLKDCIQAVFKDDITSYFNSYFCSIDVKAEFYAGACCIQKPAPSTFNRRIFRSLEDLSFS